MTRTYLTVAEKTSERHKKHFILHDGFEWHHSSTNTLEHMEELLKFFECEANSEEIRHTAENGEIEYFNISKDIISKCGGGFWSIDQLLELANGRRLKSFIGLSNGSLTTCYAAFDDDNNTVEILRPNPNAKDVYITLPLKAHIEFMKNHWYM